MLFYVSHNGQEHTIRVESRRNRVYVKFDDEPEERVDMVFQGNNCTFIRNNRVFFANVVGQKTDYTVWVPENTLQFKVESEHKRIVARLRGQDLDSDNQIVAKMPGKIVRIMCEAGAHVAKGDPVVVMEAMKMENEIRSPISGTVTKISVKPGQAVETGEHLIELDPDSQ